MDKWTAQPYWGYTRVYSGYNRYSEILGGYSGDTRGYSGNHDGILEPRGDTRGIFWVYSGVLEGILERILGLYSGILVVYLGDTRGILGVYWDNSKNHLKITGQVRNQFQSTSISFLFNVKLVSSLRFLGVPPGIPPVYPQNLTFNLLTIASFRIGVPSILFQVCTNYPVPNFNQMLIIIVHLILEIF